MNKKEDKSSVTETSVIKNFLKSTGFVFEMEVADYLKSNDYKIKVNELFFDYEEEKNREIDLIATKKINDIEITLIIECKQSTDKDWIFICSDQRPSIYYEYVKYYPEPYSKGIISETGVFNNTHILSNNFPVAQNAIIRRKGAKGKQINETTIRDCVTKLPKALIDYTYKNSSKKERKIFIPLVVFSNQFFSASYDGDLKVKELDFIQHSTVFDSSIYKHKYSPISNPVIASEVFLGNNDKEDNIPVSKLSKALGKHYLIDFSTKMGLGRYIGEIEKGLNTIDLSNWDMKEMEEDHDNPLSLLTEI